MRSSSAVQQKLWDDPNFKIRIPYRALNIETQPRSYAPKKEESHKQLKQWLADAFNNEANSTLTKVCQEVANKWKESNDFSYLKVGATVMIIREDKYKFDQKVGDLLGVYLEYALNSEFLCVGKWTNRMNDENIADSDYIQK